MEITENNVVQLQKTDLECTIGEIDSFAKQSPEHAGLTRARYTDEHDDFEMLLQPSNSGWQVSCRLNNQTSYQLNNRFFGRGTSICSVMLIAAGAPAGTDPLKFFS